MQKLKEEMQRVYLLYVEAVKTKDKEAALKYEMLYTMYYKRKKTGINTHVSWIY